MSTEYTGEELGAGVCVILVAMEPGGRVRLHRHPYEEVFVVQAGEATFTLGDEERVVRPPEVVVAPAGLAHAFANAGTETLRQVDIHVSPQFETEWLEGAKPPQK
jgi:quercetin dioxygenase-like cupin family protein